MAQLASTDTSVFNERVRLARKTAGIKIRTVADALGISPKQYRLYEGASVMPLDLVAPFCAITRVSPLFLLTGQLSPAATESNGKENIHAVIGKVHGILVPQNHCGAPCPKGAYWCRPRCEHRN
jgi:transcriptional regulator with XRE-family HTH domain